MWQALPLDLLRLIYEETHHQTILEASGYRSPTWCILRALQSIFQVNVVVPRRVNNHGSVVLQSRWTTIQVFLGTSARTKSDSGGEPETGGPGEMPH